MAKLNMKDYEDFLKEEARQDRLQEELESKREFESLGSEEYWRDYQRKQEEDKRAEMIDCDFDYDYEDYGYDYDDYEDEEDDDFDLYLYPTVYRTIENMQDVMNLLDDITGYPSCKEYEQDEFKTEDTIDEIDYLEVLISEIDEQHLREMLEQSIIQKKTIERKAPARLRHHNEVKAKKRAKNSASILTRKCLRGDFRLPYEEYRLVTRSSAAIKKANRVKIA